MKRIICILASMVILFSFGMTCFAVEFTDITDDAWYKTYVYDLAEKEVINGYPDGTYRPTNKVTVGAFLKLIILASIGDKYDLDLIEPDSDHWAGVYLKVAENFGVVEEGEYSKEDLDREITRIEIVRLLSRCDLIILEGLQKSTRKEFTDTQDISEEDNAYLLHAVAIGVINGDPAGTFRPNDSLLRSECAKVIYTYTNR